MRRHLRTIFSTAALCAFTLCGASSAVASIEVNYVGTGAGAAGLNANAVFELVSPTQLKVTLTNNSSGTYGGAGVNGDSNMVLSSINFELGSASIVGGSVALNGSSSVVSRSGSAWATNDDYVGNLNNEYGYANTGIGNASGAAILSGIAANEVDNLLDSAVTSHNNGGNAVTSFTGGTGLPGGGLTFGLVALGSTAFGNGNFVLDSIVLNLNLSGPLSDLSFLQNGSYVEFGSDYAYVGGKIVPTPDPDGEPSVPEPASLAVFSVLALIGGGSYYRRKQL